MMTKEQVIEWAKSRGFEPDGHGHLQRTIGDFTHRIKLQATSMRYEKRIQYSDGTRHWSRQASGYYKNLSIAENGKLSGVS